MRCVWAGGGRKGGEGGRCTTHTTAISTYAKESCIALASEYRINNLAVEAAVYFIYTSFLKNNLANLPHLMIKAICFLLH